MSKQPERIIAIVEPLPSGESMARRVLALLRDTPVRELYWVTLTGEIGMEFDVCQFPWSTPCEWLRQTSADLESRWHHLARQLEMPRWRFQLLPGAPNPALAELSASWSADRILASRSDWQLISGQDRPAWLFPPHPLTGTPHTLSDPPGIFSRTRAILRIPGWRKTGKLKNAPDSQ
ncbi:MAG: hypothetical protein HQL86_01025 [Magnetococcales bacterium]|nr:hypothetical protein [Magnetococcales bacterium]